MSWVVVGARTRLGSCISLHAPSPAPPPPLLKRSVQLAYQRRWAALLAFAAQRAYGLSLLELPMAGAGCLDGNLPPLAEVLADDRWGSPPVPSGMPLVARFAIKPIATLHNPLPSVDLDTGEPVQAHFERSDVCQVPPAGVIGEAMIALVLANAFMEKFGGDSVPETRRNYVGYMNTIGPRKIFQ